MRGPRKEKASVLEEGVFGLESVKCGDDDKQQVFLLRNLRQFRAGMLVVLVIFILALSCAVRYWYRAGHTGMKLAASELRRVSADCGAVVQGILLKQDEVDELAMRLQQRELFDRFLDAEKEVEIRLRKRVMKNLENGPESADRRREIIQQFAKELQWFMMTVDRRATEIIGPLDAAFLEVPERIKTLQGKITKEMVVFEDNQEGVARPMCEDLTGIVSSATWAHAFRSRLVKMAKEAVENGRQEIDLGRAPDPVYGLAQNWTTAHAQDAQIAVPVGLFAGLLRRYVSMDAQALRHSQKVGQNKTKPKTVLLWGG